MIVATRKIKPLADRYLIYDISLTSPGFACIDVSDRKPTLVHTAHIKTDTSQPYGQRFAIIEAFAITTASEWAAEGCVVIREDYVNARSKQQAQAVYGAWAAIDSGLQRCGLIISDNVNATAVKRIVGGHGKAEKAEVAAGARRILGLPDTFVWATNDESDAAGIGLAYLIEKGLIDV